MAILTDAQSVYGTETTGLLDLTPRQSFNFSLMIEAVGMSPAYMDRVASVSLPDISFATSVVNQYNKPRVITTKMHYGQVTVGFYDTFDGEFFNLMKAYTRHYFNSTQGIDPAIGTEGNILTAPTFSTKFGYTLTQNADRYFFPTIKIVQTGMGPVFDRTTVLHNSMVVSASYNTLTYESSSPVMINVIFAPESITASQPGSNRHQPAQQPSNGIVANSTGNRFNPARFA